MTGVRYWTAEVVVTAKGITKEGTAPTGKRGEEGKERARGVDEARLWCFKLDMARQGLLLASEHPVARDRPVTSDVNWLQG